MKFFPELGLCFGTGASDVTQMAVETTLSLPPPPEQAPAAEVRRFPCRSKRRRLMKVHSTKQWKPELSAIAEDRVVADGRRKEELTTIRSEKKAEEKSPSKRPSKYGGDDYRKSCHQMAIPAFSPTPFVF